jgi:putative ABC transport system permease protein
MSFRESARAAFGALRANVVRSFLALLGIVIGVAAVITMVSIGMGARAYIDAQIEALGANVVLVTAVAQQRGGVRATGNRLRLTERDARALKTELPSVVAAAPTISMSTQVVSGNRNWPTTVHGIEADYLSVRQWEIAEGRDFDVEELRFGGRVALLGATVAREVFGNANPLGRTIRVNRVPLTVVGVLERKGQSVTSNDQNDVILMPLAAARTRLVGRQPTTPGAVDLILMSVADTRVLGAVKEQTLALLRQRHRLSAGASEAFRVLEMTEFLETRAQAAGILQTVLVIVASISLLVGGIGIMNIMLVSVMERTAEIGIRRAVGAQRTDILQQFLTEAVMLCAVGGAAGIALGMGAAEILAIWAGVPAVFHPVVIAIAVLFSAAIGLFFGYYPAHKAATCEPIQALRYA